MKLITFTGGKNILAADNLAGSGLKTASQATKAIELLEKREVISKNSTYSIQDPIFLRWIEQIPGSTPE